MKTQTASTKIQRDEASMLELNLLMAKAGYLSFTDLCKELNVPYGRTHKAFYMGAKRGKGAISRKIILDHLRKKGA